MDTLDQEESDSEGDSASAQESMETLLAQQALSAEKLSSHQVAWVKVIAVTTDAVLVDIGAKNEGAVPRSEFVGAGNESTPAGTLPAVGQRIPVVMVSSRSETNPVLSYRKAKARLAWEGLVKAYEGKARVRGRVQSAVKGGFLVDISGVGGFLPASLADVRPVRDPKRLVGTGVRCLIIELNEGKKQVVLSRKAVLEEENAKRREKMLSRIKVGDVLVGRVVRVTAAGLVVDVGGLEATVKAEDLAWGVSSGSKQAVGDKVRAKVLSKDGAVTLGVKQLKPNPADALRRKYPPKTVIRGTIVESGTSGVKIALPEGRYAVSSPSENDPQKNYKAGETVSAIVLGVHPQTFHVTVSINRYEEIEDRKRAARYLKTPPPLTLGQVLSADKGE